jgi:hypothetical protein
MKKKKLLLSALMLTVVVLATALTGCRLFKTPKETGLQIGFITPSYADYTPNGIIVGIKSGNTEFYLNDITLSFYYGLLRVKISEPYGNEKERYEKFIAVYFIKGEYANKLSSTFDDYKNIEGFYHIKDIPLEEFNSSVYEVKSSSRPSSFAHVEQMTIPREFIESLEYDFWGFTVQTVIFDKQENEYKFDPYPNGLSKHLANTIWINSKIMENNKVQLSER